MSPVYLEDFGTASASGSAGEAEPDEAFEAARLDVFETGYQAGWDDAVKAQQSENSKVSADLASNLQDLSFTYQEARAALLTALRPALNGLVDRVLPELAKQMLAARVSDLISAEIGQVTDAALELAVAPADQATLEKLVSAHAGSDISIAPDPTLCAGQVFLRFSDRELELDTPRLLGELASAIDAFFETELEEQQHV